MNGLVRISDFWGTASKSKSPKMLALKILAVVGWIESQMLECPLVLAGINSWPPCLCCPFKPPPCIQTCACTPLRPLHLQRRKFDWTPAQTSTDSPSLSADLAHERLWQLARWAEFQTPPTPLLFPVPFFLPPKKVPALKRRHAAKTGTTTIMASVLMCNACAATASFGTAALLLQQIIRTSWNQWDPRLQHYWM